MEEQESQAEALLGQTEALRTLHVQAFPGRSHAPLPDRRLAPLAPARSGSPRPAPQRKFYSALPGRAQAGWLPLRQEAGGPAGWGMERTPGLP